MCWLHMFGIGTHGLAKLIKQSQGGSKCRNVTSCHKLPNPSTTCCCTTYATITRKTEVTIIKPNYMIWIGLGTNNCHTTLCCPTHATTKRGNSLELFFFSFPDLFSRASCHYGVIGSCFPSIAWLCTKAPTQINTQRPAIAANKVISIHFSLF
jgi:hypothetical protein